MTRCFVTTCLLLFTLPAFASQPISLWEVRGSSNSIYLLGSVHLLRETDYPLPSRIEDAYQEAESIYMEIDMDDLDPIAMQTLINELGVLDDGRTLKDLLGDERYAEAAAAAQAMNIPLDLLSKTEPWLAAITIEQMVLARLGFDPTLGVEMKLSAKAVADGKPVEGFETVEEQISFLDGLSPEAQKDMLMQTLQEGINIESMMDELIEAWHRGDSAFFEETVLADMQDFPELYDVILVDRNVRWVEQINELLDDEDDYMIIVGALHLVGPDGVPALLEAQGTPVIQLNQTESSLAP